MRQLLKGRLTGNSLLETGGMQRGAGGCFHSAASPSGREGCTLTLFKNIVKKPAATGFLQSQKGECIFKSIPEFSVTPSINKGDNHQRIYHNKDYQEKMAIRTTDESIVIMNSKE
jgi:hypothetical protein